MQVDDGQAEIVRRDRLVGVQQEVADVAVAMVDPSAVHHAGHACHFGDQRVLEFGLRRLFDPVEAEVFEADGGRQLFSDDERVLRGRVAALFAIGDGRHGRYADFMQALDRTPFLARPEYWQLGGQQVFEDFTPANATVNFHKETTPVDFSTQGTSTFQLAVYLAFQTLDFGERIASGPQAFERFGKNQFHRCCSARITSAACCGML